MSTLENRDKCTFCVWRKMEADGVSNWKSFRGLQIKTKNFRGTRLWNSTGMIWETPQKAQQSIIPVSATHVCRQTGKEDWKFTYFRRWPPPLSSLSWQVQTCCKLYSNNVSWRNTAVGGSSSWGLTLYIESNWVSFGAFQKMWKSISICHLV